MRGRWVSVRSTPRAVVAFPGVQPLEGYSLEIRVRVWEMTQVDPRVALWLLPVSRLYSRGVKAAELATLNLAVRSFFLARTRQ